jgi:outer membrane biosynthesis protein TonB
MTRSPRRLKQRVQETVEEQVRDLPVHAVRLAMFGVGRALLLSDRVTRDYKEITEGDGIRPVLGRLRHDVQHTAEKVVDHVTERVRGPEPAAAPPPPKPEPTPADQEITVGKPEPKPQPTPTRAPEAADLPVPDYDTATLPQLRARLRGLTSAQIGLLREYERAHAARPEILTMYENRIAKLNGHA